MADSKSTADVLVELIYSWIEKRERCAHQLRKLAEELESHRKRCNISETVGSSAAVVGAAALIGAGVATLLTAGAAAPLLIGAAVSGGVGTTISVGTKITEHFLSSSAMKEAQEIEKESVEIAGKIQRQFEQLKKEIKEARSFIDPDEEDRNGARRAGARRSSLQGSIDFSNNLNFSTEGLSNSACGVAPAFIAIFAFFTFVSDGKHMKRLADKGTKQLIQLMSTAAFKTALKGGTMVVGGAVGMAFALHEAIDSWKEMIENNHMTEASKSLRDTAAAILEMTQTLRKQLDDIRKAPWLVRLLRSVEETFITALIKTAIENCKNETVVQWLRENSESEAFSKLLDLFHFLKRHIDEEEKKNHSNSVDITFVAHGAIRDSMIPASCLLPLSSITDVVLYSPWNCTMRADVAYGVATGRMKPQHRVFTCMTAKHGCQTPPDKHRPTNLPNHWNSLKNAGDQMIPNITLSPLTPQDGFWKSFQSLTEKYGEPERNRIIIPYLLPAGSVPFSVVTLALSLVLLSSRFEATVHLTACLGDQSAGRKFDRDYLETQYACTVDDTTMTSSPDMLTGRWIDVFKRLFG